MPVIITSTFSIWFPCLVIVAGEVAFFRLLQGVEAQLLQPGPKGRHAHRGARGGQAAAPGGRGMG
jgi:hypothetical protein